MSKIDTLISQLCPDGVKRVRLGDCCQILDAQRKPVAKGQRTGGVYPYYGANGIQDYVDGYLFDGRFLLIGEDGSVINKDNSPILNWAEGKIWVNNHAHILSELTDKALLRYLYYALQGADVSDIVRGTPPKLNQANLRDISIPLPPLPIQEEIVKILDRFAVLTAELEAELEGRRKQYEYYRTRLLSFDSSSDTNAVRWMRLGEVGKVCMCKRILKNQTNSEGGIPFFKIGTFGKIADSYIDVNTYEEYKSKYSYPKVGEVLISAAGTIGKAVIFNGEPSYFQDSNIVWISHNENLVLNKYLFYCYQIINWKIDDGGVIKRLYNDNLKSAIIPIPSLSEQERIVNILDKFDQLVNGVKDSIPALIDDVQKQYEFYRNKLLTFPE